MIAWIAENPAITTLLALLLVYPVVIRGLAKAVWPARAALADELRGLEHDPNLSANAQNAIKILGDYAFSWWMMPALVVTFPFTALERVVSRKLTGLNPLTGFDAETQKRIDRAVVRFVASAAARNPLFALLFAVEVGIVALVQFVAARLRQLVRGMAVRTATEQRAGVSMSAVQTVHRTLSNAVGRFDWFLTRFN